jgi:hypothetical protein
MDCVLFLEAKDTKEKIVLMMMPYNDGDKYFLDIESAYSAKGIGFRGFWKKLKHILKRMAL